MQSAQHVIEQRRAQLQQSQSKLDQYRHNAPRQIAIQRATVRSNEASAQSANAQVEQARLKLSYCRIAAPVSGIVMRRSAEVGAHISAGQQLLQIAQIGDIWVTANFKETQLRNIKTGQSVTIHVDALKHDFDGTSRISAVQPAQWPVFYHPKMPPETSSKLCSVFRCGSASSRTRMDSRDWVQACRSNLK